MRRGLDARMIQSRRRFPERYLYRQRRGNFDGPHAVAFAVALDGVAIAEEEMRALLIDAQRNRIAAGNLLHVQIAAVGTIVDGQDRAMHRRDADDTDHRLYRQL